MIYNLIWNHTGNRMLFATGDIETINASARHLRAGARPELLGEFTVVSETGEARPLLEYMAEHDI